MLFFYIRHGDPIYDPDSLTPLGTQQAEALGKRLSRYGVDKIYASTSNRAVLTATPTAHYTKREIVKLDWCHEGHAWNDYACPNENGDYRWPAASPMIKQLLMKPEVLSLGQKWYEHPDVLAKHDFAPGIARVNRETDALLASLGYEHDRENGVYRAVNPNDLRVALFAHYGFGTGFLSSLLDIPYSIFCSHFDIGHSGMTVINFRNEQGTVIPQVLTFSGDAHIYAEGLPTKYNNEIFF